ncbi:MAG: hypothetical protein IPH16_04880 [Haliscomenobacter sp.]|nr:hypothetical protein [Haliscomenobacter sp.]
MKKNAIWIIIALMSAAVMGVVWLQMDLIRMSIRVNEERFDKNVYSVLNKVVEQIKEEEAREELFSSLSLNGFITKYVQQERFSNGRQEGQAVGASAAISGNQLLNELMEDPKVYALYGLTLGDRPSKNGSSPASCSRSSNRPFEPGDGPSIPKICVPLRHLLPCEKELCHCQRALRRHGKPLSAGPHTRASPEKLI